MELLQQCILFWVDNTAYTTVTQSYNPSSSTSITYDPVDTGSGSSTATVTSSNTFEYLLPQALYECLKFILKNQLYAI